jgi:hypothetical protein
VAEVSEPMDVRFGSPLPLRTQKRAGRVNFDTFRENDGIHEDKEDRLYLMFNAGVGGSSV